MIEVQLHPGMVRVTVLMIATLLIISFQLVLIGRQLSAIESVLKSIRNRL